MASGESPFYSLANQLFEKQGKATEKLSFRKKQGVHFLEEIIDALIPQHRDSTEHSVENLQSRLNRIHDQFLVLTKSLVASDTAKIVIEQFVKWLPELYETLMSDAQATYNGDPAAVSTEEVIITYPGFFAILIYRTANFFYKKNIPLLPRIFSEYAHSKTGIDIHPGATIAGSFCIDHGTGVVIGETTEIKERVKIYQGVTLGALSVDKSLGATKRHPTVEEDVVIYANATILGGATVIGKGSVIGGNVWLTKSVQPGTKVYEISNVDSKNLSE